MRWGRETSFVGCTQTPKMAAGVQRQPRRAHQKSPNWFRETTELINWGAKAGCEVEDMAGAEGHPVKQGLDGEAQCVGCNGSLPRITNRARGGWGEEEKVWNAFESFYLKMRPISIRIWFQPCHADTSHRCLPDLDLSVATTTAICLMRADH